MITTKNLKNVLNLDALRVIHNRLKKHLCGFLGMSETALKMEVGNFEVKL